MKSFGPSARAPTARITSPTPRSMRGLLLRVSSEYPTAEAEAVHKKWYDQGDGGDERPSGAGNSRSRRSAVKPRSGDTDGGPTARADFLALVQDGLLEFHPFEQHVVSRVRADRSHCGFTFSPRTVWSRSSIPPPARERPHLCRERKVGHRQMPARDRSLGKRFSTSARRRCAATRSPAARAAAHELRCRKDLDGW